MLRTDHRLRSLAAISVLGVLAVLAVACGDGGESRPLREQLKQMTLQPEDLPAGFVQVAEAFSTNEELARASGDAEEQMAKLQAWGRLLGYERVFEPGEGADTGSPIIGVENTISLYATAKGAEQSFAEAVQTARETDWALTHPGFENLQVQEIQVSGLADEALWLRITGLSGQRRLFDDFVLSRQGNARSLLRAASVSDDTDPDSLLDVVEGLLTSQMERISAVLNAGP